MLMLGSRVRSLKQLSIHCHTYKYKNQTCADILYTKLHKLFSRNVCIRCVHALWVEVHVICCFHCSGDLVFFTKYGIGIANRFGRLVDYAITCVTLCDSAASLISTEPIKSNILINRVRNEARTDLCWPVTSSFNSWMTSLFPPWKSKQTGVPPTWTSKCGSLSTTSFYKTM